MRTVERVLINNGAEMRALGLVSQIVDAIIAEHLTPTEHEKAVAELLRNASKSSGDDQG